MRIAPFVVLIAALAIAGCGFLPTADGTFGNAPAVVRDRATLPACGTESVQIAHGVNLDGRRCFWNAYQSHQPAEFISTQTTIEGDPVTSVYRVLPDGAVEVFVDSTQDTWSTRTWLHLACRELSLIDDAPGQPAFGPGPDCVETTIR